MKMMKTVSIVLSIVALMSAAVVGGRITHSASATVPGDTWYFSNVTYINGMYGVNPSATAAAFNKPESFSITTNSAAPGKLPAGFVTTPILKYTSYAQFVNDVSSGIINPAFKWVMYDNESWSQTPQNEQDDPWTYMAKFAALAKDHGFKVMLTPARDLGSVTTSVNPAQPGESLDHWFVRTGIAATAAVTGAEIVHIQTQADTLNLNAFVALWKSTTTQVEATTSPMPVMSAGVSTAYGNASDMDAVTHMVGASGYWVNVPDTNYTEAAQFLALQIGV